MRNVTFDGDDDEELYNPITYEQDPDEPVTEHHEDWQTDNWAYAEPSSDFSASPGASAVPPDLPLPPPSLAPGSQPTAPEPILREEIPREELPREGIWPDESWPPRLPPRPRRPRWLVPGAIAAVALAAGLTFALVGGGSGAKQAATSAGRSAAGPAAGSTAKGSAAGSTAGRSAAGSAGTAKPSGPPAGAQVLRAPISVSAAQAVLNSYTTTNNTANTQMSDSLLATYETGGSYALDAGSYREQQAMNLGPYPAFGPIHTHFYIPLESAAYPHWFAVEVTNATFAKPRKAANTELLVFTQASSSASWLQAVEPYIPAGSAVPPIALGRDGYATAVTSATPGLAVAPGQIAAVTAQSLDGHGPVPNPGDLAEFQDAAYWQPKLPKGSTVTISHSPAADGVFGLRTTDGGALLFYTDAAEVTVTAPHGHTMHLAVPGFYQSSWTLTSANLGFMDQFAAYDPPAGTSGPHLVAEYSGLTS